MPSARAAPSDGDVMKPKQGILLPIPCAYHPSLMPFEFLEPGPLIDGELELVPPNPIYVEDVLAACRHPLTVRDAPKEAQSTTRETLARFLRAAPGGREQGDPARGWVPSYHFWMKLDPAKAFTPVRIAGGI